MSHILQIPVSTDYFQWVRLLCLFMYVCVQVAARALAAGQRRKQLAASVASTASSSGSSGKRTHVSLDPTPSTKVTPEAKQTCAVQPNPVEPCQLSFEVAATQGGGLRSQFSRFVIIVTVSFALLCVYSIYYIYILYMCVCWHDLHR